MNFPDSDTVNEDIEVDEREKGENGASKVMRQVFVPAKGNSEAMQEKDKKKEKRVKRKQDNNNDDYSSSENKTSKKLKASAMQEEESKEETQGSILDQAVASPLTDTVPEVPDFVQIVPAPPDKDFVATISYPQSFKQLVKIMSGVLDVVQLTVQSNKQFCGLTVNSFDSKNTCMVIARFQCETKVRGERSHYFCVKMSTFNTILEKLINPRWCMELHRDTGMADIRLISYDPQDSSQYQDILMNTQDRDEEKDTLETFNSDYTVEIDLNEFRSIVSTAQVLKAEDMCFQILEEKEKGPLRSSYLVLSIDADAKIRKVYHSLTAWNDPDTPNVVIKTAEQTRGIHTRMPDQSQLKERLHENFSISYLTNFMKSMKTNTITLRLSSEGAPMVLSHPLGSDSQISFVLAPKEKSSM